MHMFDVSMLTVETDSETVLYDFPNEALKCHSQGIFRAAFISGYSKTNHCNSNATFHF